jgi:hypothetical protein
MKYSVTLRSMCVFFLSVPNPPEFGIGEHVIFGPHWPAPTTTPRNPFSFSFPALHKIAQYPSPVGAFNAQEGAFVGGGGGERKRNRERMGRRE